MQRMRTQRMQAAQAVGKVGKIAGQVRPARRRVDHPFANQSGVIMNCAIRRIAAQALRGRQQCDEALVVGVALQSVDDEAFGFLCATRGDSVRAKQYRAQATTRLWYQLT